MHRAGARRRIAHAGRHVIELAAALGGDSNRRPDAIAITLGSLERHLQPVSAALAAVHPDLRGFAEGCRNNIDAPVAIEISERTSTVARDLSSSKSSVLCECLPLPLRPRIAKNCVGLIDLCSRQWTGNSIAPRDEQILPAVVVEVVKCGAECGHGQRQGAHAALRRHFTKLLPTHVL